MSGLLEVYSLTLGDEEGGRMLDLSVYLRSWTFGVEWGPIDYTGNDNDWHIQLHVGPLRVQYTRLGRLSLSLTITHGAITADKLRRGTFGD